MNAFYNSYDATDNSININGKKVNIDGSIIGDGNHDNIVGDKNIVGDNNTVVKGDGNAVAKVDDSEGTIVGTGNGNGNGNIDGNVNNTNSGNDGNTVDSNNSADVDIDATNNTLKDVLNDNSDHSNNTAETVLPPYYPPVTKRDVVSCFSFKYLTAVNNLLPCIFTAISSSNPRALLQCGVSKVDVCASAGCMPEGIQEYIADLCSESSSPIHRGPVTDDLADPEFHESTDNNIRAFLGLLTQSELTAIRNYESSHAKKTGVESSCVLGSRCGENNDCCLGTCGTHNGGAKCYGII
jgi:hypothetical protein